MALLPFVYAIAASEMMKPALTVPFHSSARR
jgi:hypothetical protein